MPASNMCSCSEPQGEQEQHRLHTEVTMNIDQLMQDIMKVETVQLNIVHIYAHLPLSWGLSAECTVSSRSVGGQH